MTLKKEIKVLKAENQLLREHAHVPSEVKSPRDKGKQGETRITPTSCGTCYAENNQVWSLLGVSALDVNFLVS